MKTLDIVKHTLCLIPSVTGFFETKSKQSFSSFSRLIFLNDKLNIQQCCYKFVPKLERDNILFWMVISNFFHVQIPLPSKLNLPLPLSNQNQNWKNFHDKTLL